RADLDSNKMQGFPLAYSQKLLLLRYVHEFYLDGLLLVRRCDITDSYCRKTEKFQRKLLETEHKLKKGVLRNDHVIDDFTSFIDGLGSKKIVIVENESKSDPKFYIGLIASADTKSVHVQEFSGAGKWEHNATCVSIDEITCCQIETNYINFYSRHFARTT
ncbi:hypothetical protein OAU93_01700, partial [bacterium]|nr:hypothetical protein [bacterium]